MPDPKKKKTAPANAATDTATSRRRRPLSRTTTQTQGTGDLQRRAYDKDYNVWATAGTDGSAGQTYGKVTEPEGERGKKFTPLVQNAKYSNPKGSAAAKTERATRRDPFLDGINSEAPIAGRRKGAKRK